MELRFKKLNENVKTPVYSSDGASCLDVFANLKQNVILKPGESKEISTGLIFEIPSEYEIQLRPRSGLAVKHGIGLSTFFGTIDSDYRGELRVFLYNRSDQKYIVKNEDRVAQMVLVYVGPQIQLKQVSEVNKTPRGENGFGSTGI